MENIREFIEANTINWYDIGWNMRTPILQAFSKNAKTENGAGMLDEYFNSIPEDQVLAIKKEMVGKVNVEVFTTMVCASDSQDGSVNIKENQLATGVVRKYLKQWSDNKWRLYLILGRQLRTKVDTESFVDDQETILFRRNVSQLNPYFGIITEAFHDTSDWTKDGIKYGDDGKYLPRDITRHKSITSLSHFIFDDNDFEMKLADALAEIKTSSYAWLSIDPCDYMTMSTNNHGWTSCHNIEAGCYTRGTLGYAMDDCTILSYLASEGEYFYDCCEQEFRWNSKSWRACLYVDPENGGCVLSRQYPGKNKIAAQAIYTLWMQKFIELLEVVYPDKIKGLKVITDEGKELIKFRGYEVAHKCNPDDIVAIKKSGLFFYGSDCNTVYHDATCSNGSSYYIYTDGSITSSAAPGEYYPCPICGRNNDGVEVADGTTACYRCIRALRQGVDIDDCEDFDEDDDYYDEDDDF